MAVADQAFPGDYDIAKKKPLNRSPGAEFKNKNVLADQP